MKFMLIALIGFLMLAVALGIDPGPLPGLNLKNALLYVIMLVLLLRVTLDRRYRIQMPSIPMVFIVLIIYAMAMYAMVVMVIHYPGYDWLRNGILLKNTLVDQMMFFLVFFYGLRSDEEANVDRTARLILRNAGESRVSAALERITALPVA